MRALFRTRAPISTSGFQISARACHSTSRSRIRATRQVRCDSRGILIEKRLRSVFHVTHGHCSGGVTEKLVHSDDRHPSLRGMYGEGVPGIVRPRPRDLGCCAGRVPHLPDDTMAFIAPSTTPCAPFVKTLIPSARRAPMRGTVPEPPARGSAALHGERGARWFLHKA